MIRISMLNSANKTQSRELVRRSTLGLAVMLTSAACGLMSGCHSAPTPAANEPVSAAPGGPPPANAATQFEQQNPNMSPQAKQAMENQLADMGRTTTSGKKPGN